MRAERQFEFQASFSNLEEGLDLLHRSVDGLRRAIGRRRDDRELMLFETALGEIGSNVLTHGRPAGAQLPIEYTLHLDGRTIVASLTDFGPPAHEHLERTMPDTESEDGRGLVLARELLDELGYERDGDRNHWRLVKRL
jgi:serine/threonine-protein kinase RsbW